MAYAVALGARSVPGWSGLEELLAQDVPKVEANRVRNLRASIRDGADPLGEAFCRLRSPAERRQDGATYTPQPIVEAMLAWAAAKALPSRVVDPGSGSGRFLLEAGRRFTNAELVGIELDPLAAAVTRASLAAARLARRARVELADYRSAILPPIEGRTLYVGNPPYVRHHQIPAPWKQWLIAEANRRGLSASQLAGLHVYFFLATVNHATAGDYGSFITASEWLDVNYGSLVRDLFLGGLGGQRIVIIEPEAMPFPDAQTTAAITLFEIGSKAKSVGFRRVKKLSALDSAVVGRVVRRERLEAERRWTFLSRGARNDREGFVELGEICRVHRGQVTGNNKVWIAGEHSADLPDSVLFRTVTRARELIEAGSSLNDASHLRSVIDIPASLDGFDRSDRKAIDRFLVRVQGLGVTSGFVAKTRRVWWSVGLRTPAPILATYMARRPPAFVLNVASARHINIAHGLYPREALAERTLRTLVEYLSHSTTVQDGRTYAGGLTKFEPREMERILVPSPTLLAEGAG